MLSICDLYLTDTLVEPLLNEGGGEEGNDGTFKKNPLCR